MGFSISDGRLLLAYCVEKPGVWMMVKAAVGYLARGDLLDVPPSVQMMGFVG
jgi:hypothetical protein